MRTVKAIFTISIIVLMSVIISSCNNSNKDFVTDTYSVKYGSRHTVTITEIATGQQHKYKIVRTEKQGITDGNRTLLSNDTLHISNQDKSIIITDKTTGESRTIKP